MAGKDKEKVRDYNQKYYFDHRDEINAKRNANPPESVRIYREKNRETLNTKNKARYSANKEKEHARRKAYYESHKEEAAAYIKARMEADPLGERKKWNAYRKKYRIAHPKEVKAYILAWNEANKDKVLLYAQIRRANKTTGNNGEVFEN